MMASNMEMTNRANFLIYEYLLKQLDAPAFANEFKKFIQTTRCKDIITFKGLTCLTDMIMQHYSDKKPVDAEAAIANCTSTNGDLNSIGDKGEEAAAKKLKKKNKKKKKINYHNEAEEEEEEAAPVETTELATTTADADAAAAVDTTADATGTEETKKKKKKKKKNQKQQQEEDEKKKEEDEEECVKPNGDAADENLNNGVNDSATKEKDEEKDEQQQQKSSGKKRKREMPVNDGDEAEVENKKKCHGQPYRRVREEEVENKHFKDNSFDAKPNARHSWGYKANQDLLPTQGKSFRHEKTKKKRGSYKGGAIDTAVTSMKFDSDDE